MARYGRDFTSGRYTRPDFQDRGYDFGYRGDNWGDRYSSRGMGWNDTQGSRGWGARGSQWGQADLDESWSSMGHGRGRRDFGETGWRTQGSTSGGYHGDRMGEYVGRRNLYDREMRGFGGRMGHDYDADFGDRIRRGWNRLRDEAREWMGRDYDRGW